MSEYDASDRVATSRPSAVSHTDDIIRVPASRLLTAFAEGWTGPRVAVRELVDVLHDRAYGLLMLLFSFPNVIPNPIPGVSGLLAVPLILISAQLAVGRPHPWLPRWVGEYTIDIETVRRMVRILNPWLEKAERMLKPRLAWACSVRAERLLASLCLVLAVVLLFPIPLGNALPGLAISLIALGLIEHDGVFVGTGVLVALVSLVVALVVVVAMVKAFIFFLSQAF